MSYVPIHDRVSSPPPSVRYASPDLDPTAPLGTSDRQQDNEYGHGEQDNTYAQGEEQQYDAHDAGPSRKRRRDDYDGDSGNGNGQGRQSQPQARSNPHSSSSSRALPPVEQVTMDTAIAPSIFGIAPRNEFTKTIGEFIMGKCRGVENIEIEIKLGTLHSVSSNGQPQKRIRMPTMSEMSE